MEWSILIPLLVAAVGWLLVHRLAAWRDRAAKRREVRITYLIQAYRRFMDFYRAMRGPTPPNDFTEVESAITDIELFGSVSQIAKLRTFVQDLQKRDKVSLNDLAEDLRDDLRRELRLKRIEGRIVAAKISRADDEESPPAAQRTVSTGSPG